MDLSILRDELERRRVAVWRPETSAWYPIPVALTPTVVSKSVWQHVVADARLIFCAFPKLLKWLQLPEQIRLKEKIFSGLSGIERLVGDLNPDEQWGHVTARFDLYWHHDEIKIIEVNCTIPAMQAYSDNVLHAWLAAGGSKAASPSNISQLLQSLVTAYHSNGGQAVNPRVLILHRPGDSQQGELLCLREEWKKLGIDSDLATPNSVSRAADHWNVNGKSYHIIYRHIFAWRLEDGPIKDSLLAHRKMHIYNPVSAHYESKSFLALLSHVASDQAMSSKIGLTVAEISAVNRRVPWSRIIGMESFAVPAHEIQNRLSEVVLKRSVGYGGHQVFMGCNWSSVESQSRLRQLTNYSSEVDFGRFAEWVNDLDVSLWIAQDRMSGIKRKTQVLCGDRIEEWDGWFDASVFINSASDPICSGGVSRIAKSPIVNIGVGGGLAPFVIS